MICTACGDPHQQGAFCTGCGAPLRTVAPAPAASALPPQVPVEERPLARNKGAESFLALQASETAVLHAASRIYAAYVAAGKVPDGGEAEMIEKSVRAATKMAVMTDRLVQSDDEEW